MNENLRMISVLVKTFLSDKVFKESELLSFDIKNSLWPEQNSKRNCSKWIYYRETIKTAATKSTSVNGGVSCSKNNFTVT